MRFVRRLVTRAAIAAGILGAIEAVRLGDAPLADRALAAGLASAGALVAAGALLTVAALLFRLPPLARWRTDLAAPGPTRIAAIARAGLLVVAGGVLWGSVLATTAWAAPRFKAHLATGLLVASLTVVVVATLALAVAAGAGPLGRWLGARTMLARWTTGRRGLALGLALATTLVIGAGPLVLAIAPGFEVDAPWAAVALVITVVVVAAVRVETRLAAPTAIALGVLVGGGAVAAVARVGSHDEARARIAARGAASRVVLEALWSATDRDGDGYAGSFGGGDCDDHDARVSPTANEVPDNGRDDNCLAGDATAATLAERLASVAARDPAAPRRDIVLFTIDTLRADHVGAYGYARPTTPHLDALAARGARFERAFTSSPITRRAVPAIMTGRYPGSLRWRPDSWPPALQSKTHRTLAETLQAAGYATAAVLCCDDVFARPTGVVAGFASVDDSAAKRGKAGDLVVDAAIQLLAQASPTPRFTWLHLFEPHEPFRNHASVPSFGEEPIDRYDAEIAFADAQLGRLLAALADLPAPPIIVVTADHGEQFEEHGSRNHGKSLYAEELQVPLVIAVPGAPPQVIGAPVSTIDVGATLLDLVGLPRPAGWSGRSHAAAVLGVGPPATRPILAELIRDRQIGRSLRAVLDGEHKLIWDLRAGTYELYDLVRDPDDRRNLADRDPLRLRAMRETLGLTSERELTALPNERDRPAQKKP